MYSSLMSVITGDIIHSTRVQDHDKWLKPLKQFCNSWRDGEIRFEIFRGDSFQIELRKPQSALLLAIGIKSLIKSIPPQDPSSRSSDLDVRMAIGFGESTFWSSHVAESNGPVYQRSGRLFDEIDKGPVTLSVESGWNEFDQLVNLYMKLISMFMNNWTYSSAEIVNYLVYHNDPTQTEMAKDLGISQNAVHKRLVVSNAKLVFETEHMFRFLFNKYSK